MRFDVLRLVRHSLGPLWLCVLAICFASNAAAAPRDKAALKKIEEAIFEKFLNTEFDAAEGLLIGTIRACEDKCSPEVKAKAWMYVGVVRGSGRNDMRGAEEAFKNARKEDENVQLDAEVASDEVKALWAKVAGGGGGGGGGGGAAKSGGGDMKCSLAVSEVQSRRPIPIACESDKDLESAKLFFESFGQEWTSVDMEVVEGVWNGTIPCSATQNTGGLRWYVTGYDGDEEEISNSGSEDDPNSLEIVSETDADPPAFPGEDPPARCGVTESGGGGGACGGWGESCGAGGCCDAGLACQDGTCQPAGCESDSDCEDGQECREGTCAGGDDTASGEARKNWIGLHFGWDVTLLSATGACTQDSRTNNHFNCFNPDGSTYNGIPNENAAGDISGGFVPSTMRVMASYERVFGSIGAEARLGFAFNGGRQPEGGDAFLPVHVELRGKYWFSGEGGFKKKGIRPWVHFGGGMAQVDATVEPDIIECSAAPDNLRDACVTGPVSPLPRGSSTQRLEVTKVLGLTFVTLGGGIEYAIAPNHGPVFNLNAMLMLPSTGFVLEPSLGYRFGF